MKKQYVSPEVMIDDATIEAMLLVTSPIPVENTEEGYGGEGAARGFGLSDDDDI